MTKENVRLCVFNKARSLHAFWDWINLLLIWLKRIKFINIYSNQQVFSLSLTFHALVEFMMMYVNIIFLYWMICWIYSQNINISIYTKLIRFVNFFSISKGNGLHLKITGKLKWVNKRKNIFRDSGLRHDFKKKNYLVNISSERLWIKAYRGRMNSHNRGSGDRYCTEVLL